MRALDCFNATCIETGFDVKVSFLPFGPFVYVLNKTENGLITDGVLIRILKSLGNSLNFKYTAQLLPDRRWGSRFSNGSWTGFIGQLQRKEIDLALGPIMMEVERFQDVRFTNDYATSPMMIIASAGNSGPNNFFSFLSTFDGLIWYLLLSLAGLCIVVSAFYETYQLNDQIRLPERLYHYFWTYLASIFCEGSFRTPKTEMGKFLLGIWLMGTLVLMNGFCGQFKAALSVQSDDDHIYTVKDLSERPHLPALLPGKTIFERAFKGSPMKEYQRIHEAAFKGKTIVHPLELLKEETQQLVKSGKATMISEELSLKNMFSNTCERLNGTRRLYIAEETFYPCQFMFMVNLKFPVFLLQKINHRIRWLKESGLIDFWIQYYNGNFWKCVQDTRQQEESQLGLEQLLPVFYMLLFFHSVSFFNLLVERYRYKKLVRYPNEKKRFKEISKDNELKEIE